MKEAAHSFDDSAGYERFIGIWGRAAGAAFLDWVAPPPAVRWLDVGCGTGLFTELILGTRSPRQVIAVDQAASQIEYARRKPALQRAGFRVADAQSLPFPNAAFDVVVSALVVNFIPERQRALSEMRRVASAGGHVAGYVWDFTNECSPSGPFRLGMREIVPEMPSIPGTETSTLDRLASLFSGAGLEAVATTTFDVTVSFPDFETFWIAQTPSYSPTTKLLAAMTSAERTSVRELVRARLASEPGGRIAYPARANAVKARVAG
jgi:ubiquinone/menaquinone biosynthesis C-methylase UbiE